MALHLSSTFFGVSEVGFTAEKVVERKVAVTAETPIYINVRDLTSPALQYAHYRNDVKSVRRLANQLDAIVLDIDRLEKGILTQGSTASSVRTAKQLLDKLARQRADAQAIAQKDEERKKAIKNQTMKDGEQSSREAREQFNSALRILMDAYEQKSRVLRKIAY
jgi:hypothetical protein